MPGQTSQVVGPAGIFFGGVSSVMNFGIQTEVDVIEDEVLMCAFHVHVFSVCADAAH